MQRSSIPPLFLLFVFVQTIRAQQPGDLDNTFNVDGIATTDFNGSPDSDVGFGMAVQSDGKIIVCGRTIIGGAVTVCMARYTPDGDLDPSFGTAGRVVTDLDALASAAFAVALQPDGKIVVVGERDSTSDAGGVVVLRYNDNGTLDSSFAGDGIACTDVGPGKEAAYAAAIQPDGRIVVAATVGYGVELSVAVIRYDPDGTLDPTFSGDGLWTYDLAGSGDELRALVLQPDGRIVVGGRSAGGGAGFILARLNADGTPDTDFGTGGFANATGGTVNGLALQPDGRIVAVGEGNEQMILVRFEADGSLDLTFGTDGVLAFSGAEHSWGRSVALMPDGRIVTAGYADTSFEAGDLQLLVAMILPGGTLDASFSNDGFQVTAPGNTNWGRSVAVQADGKVLVAGWTELSSTHWDYVVARYHTDVSLGLEEPLSTIDAAALVYPNPIGGSATLQYVLRTSEHITIRLVDARGRIVHSFAEGIAQQAGEHRLELDFPASVAAGGYTLVISSATGGHVNVQVVKG